jgi:hypothetical protein
MSGWVPEQHVEGQRFILRMLQARAKELENLKKPSLPSLRSMLSSEDEDFFNYKTERMTAFAIRMMDRGQTPEVNWLARNANYGAKQDFAALQEKKAQAKVPVRA